MNNTYFSSLLCITLLALAPACCKKKSCVKKTEEINTTIELDNTVFEMEEDNDDKKISKF